MHYIHNLLSCADGKLAPVWMLGSGMRFSTRKSLGRSLLRQANLKKLKIDAICDEISRHLPVHAGQHFSLRLASIIIAGTSEAHVIQMRMCLKEIQQCREKCHRRRMKPIMQAVDGIGLENCDPENVGHGAASVLDSPSTFGEVADLAELEMLSNDNLRLDEAALIENLVQTELAPDLQDRFLMAEDYDIIHPINMDNDRFEPFDEVDFNLEQGALPLQPSMIEIEANEVVTPSSNKRPRRKSTSPATRERSALRNESQAIVRANNISELYSLTQCDDLELESLREPVLTVPTTATGSRTEFATTRRLGRPLCDEQLQLTRRQMQNNFTTSDILLTRDKLHYWTTSRKRAKNAFQAEQLSDLRQAFCFPYRKCLNETINFDMRAQFKRPIELIVPENQNAHTETLESERDGGVETSVMRDTSDVHRSNLEISQRQTSLIDSNMKSLTEEVGRTSQLMDRTALPDGEGIIDVAPLNMSSPELTCQPQITLSTSQSVAPSAATSSASSASRYDISHGDILGVVDQIKSKVPIRLSIEEFGARCLARRGISTGQALTRRQIVSVFKHLLHADKCSQGAVKLEQRTQRFGGPLYVILRRVHNSGINL